MISAYPKIFTIGTDYIKNIFDGVVEISEKVDGSQFSWVKINGELYIRSRGAMLYWQKPEDMFRKAVDYIKSIEDRIPEGLCFYSEYLRKPKHNVLAYNHMPKNHLMLFGCMEIKTQKMILDFGKYADQFDIDVVPIIYYGLINSLDNLIDLLDTESYLGGQKVEGVVVKNYNQPFLLGGQPIPIMAGKLVSEKFKEVHREKWGSEHTHKGKWDTFKDGYCTEARWQKAVQRLRDSGQLTNSPKDIGNLIKAIQSDIIEEEQETIMKFLWKEFSGELLRTATRGFPEWYKEQLAKQSFDNK